MTGHIDSDVKFSHRSNLHISIAARQKYLDKLYPKSTSDSYLVFHYLSLHSECRTSMFKKGLLGKQLKFCLLTLKAVSPYHMAQISPTELHQDICSRFQAISGKLFSHKAINAVAFCIHSRSNGSSSRSRISANSILCLADLQNFFKRAVSTVDDTILWVYQF